MIASALLESTKRYLYGTYRIERNVLQASYTAGGVSLAFTYDLGGIRAGTYLSIDLEIFYVIAVNDQAKTASVLGAQLGSAAADHSPTTVVEVNPQFPNFSIFQEINADLLDLSSPMNGLYQIKTVDLTYNAAIVGYDLAGVTDIIDVAEIRFDTSGPENDWPRVHRYQLLRNMPVADYPSGFGLVVYDGIEPGRTVRVRYKAPYTQLAALTDDVAAVTGLHSQALDIPPLGAAWRLMSGREVHRNFDESQGNPRRSDEVPAGSIQRSAGGLLALRQQRIHAETSRLQAAWR